MSPGRVGWAVALLLLALGAGAYLMVQVQAKRTMASVDALERSLEGQATRDPFPPVQPGTFHDCAPEPQHDRYGPLDPDCSIYSNSGGAEVPASCQRVLDSGEAWVEGWLRCSQRAELGRPNPYPMEVSAGDGEAGNWLSLRLHTLPADRALELCRLTMAHARDFVWSYGPSGCYEALNELLSVKVPCGVALEKVDSSTRAAFLADARLWRSQLPPNKWYRHRAEIEALRWEVALMDGKGWSDTPEPTWLDRLKTQQRLPGLKRHYDELVERDLPSATAAMEEKLFNPGRTRLGMLQNCETLPRGFDLLIELASIEP